MDKTTTLVTDFAKGRAIEECAPTLHKLIVKSSLSYSHGVKMPSIKQISKLLTAFGIKHSVSKKTNIVEHRSKGRRYVNSRHAGKTGWELIIDRGELPNIELDTSSSYYSHNTGMYAGQILDLIKAIA
jgi:hypothetical protein